MTIQVDVSVSPTELLVEFDILVGTGVDISGLLVRLSELEARPVMPEGTLGQIMIHNGTAWVSSSTLPTE